MTLARLFCIGLVAWFGVAAAETAIVGDLPPGLDVPAEAQPGPQFDVDRATEAWLGLLSPEQRARSDAYFEGGYWLALWSLLYGLGAMAILLWTGTSRRLRELADRVGRGPWLSAGVYGAAFIVATFLLNLPFSIYEDYLREHQYGLSNLSFGGWLGERGRSDPAALPLLFALGSIIWFVLTPFTNGVVRGVEAEADAFGLNAARESQGFAMAALRLSTYRKLRPGALEEFIFYDHPSGYERVRRSMIWLNENQHLPAAKNP